MGKNWMIISLVSLLILNGCSHPWFATYRDFKKDNLTFQGHFNRGLQCVSNKVEYDTLIIDGSPNTTPNLPLVYIELKNGLVVFVPTIEVRWLEANKTWLETRRNNVKEYNIVGCSFFVYRDSVIGMSDCNGIVAIWDRSKSKRYQFPLTEQEIISLFGSPDTVREYYGK